MSSQLFYLNLPCAIRGVLECIFGAVVFFLGRCFFFLSSGVFFFSSHFFAFEFCFFGGELFFLFFELFFCQRGGEPWCEQLHSQQAAWNRNSAKSYLYYSNLAGSRANFHLRKPLVLPGEDVVGDDPHELKPLHRLTGGLDSWELDLQGRLQGIRQWSR